MENKLFLKLRMRQPLHKRLNDKKTKHKRNQTSALAWNRTSNFTTLSHAYIVSLLIWGLEKSCSLCFGNKQTEKKTTQTKVTSIGQQELTLSVQQMRMRKCIYFVSLYTSMYRTEHSVTLIITATIVSVRANLQLSNMHLTKTHLSAPRGRISENTGHYVKKLLVDINRIEWIKGICKRASKSGPKSRGASFGTTLWRHVQRYCSVKWYMKCFIYWTADL